MKRIALLFVIVGVTACSKDAVPPADHRPAAKVQTLEVQLQRTPDVNEVVGTVRAKTTATIAAKVMTAIEEVFVRPGDNVTNGQVLAKLDDRELRAEFEKAKADFDRFQKLLANQSATRAEFDAVQSRFLVAQAAVSDTLIAAPFDGVVTEKGVNAGDLATPGKTLFVIEQPTVYRLEANVPERLAGVLAVGKSIDTVVESTGEKCDGTIDEIIPTADPTSRSVLVKINLQCRQPLKSGMFGRALVLAGERFALFVPKEAVRERGQLTSVFVVDNGQARLRLVRTGKAYLGAVEIISGLQAGERVIVSSTADISDGQPIAP